jgi:small GTP-binding protein
MRSLKAVLVGDTKVGKSCILSQFVQETYDPNMPATVGAAFLTKIVATEYCPIRLQLWDTAGQEKYRSLAPMYYRSASAALLIFDVTNKNSLENLKNWHQEICEKAPTGITVYVVGNKIDAAKDRVVSSDAGRAMAQQLGAPYYFEVSAKTGEGINNLFNKVAEADVKQETSIDKQVVIAKDKNDEDSGCC